MLRLDEDVQAVRHEFFPGIARRERILSPTKTVGPSVVAARRSTLSNRPARLGYYALKPLPMSGSPRSKLGSRAAHPVDCATLQQVERVDILLREEVPSV